ncbi:agmatine/peptidylarginine deiminase [Pseudomonadota bacterium]
MLTPILPAEWATQSAVMLTWPHPHGDWAPWIESVEPVFCNIAYHVTKHQKLIISCFDDAHLEHVRNRLTDKGCDLKQVGLYVVPSNDSWTRDHGPITAWRDGKSCLLDFQFNGWGKKYESTLDNAITQRLHKLNAFGDTTIEKINLVLEGGSIESDGQGSLLTTSQCLLTPTRNPTLDINDIEKQLTETLGINHFLWLDNGHLQGDDTDSHIDTLARFCDEQTISYVSCDDPADPHYESLQAMAEELKAFKTQDGKPYRLVPLPMAKPVYNRDGVRLPATYANFLIINNAVLVPIYDDAHNNDIAIQTLSECFPTREIIAIDCMPLIEQYGSLHCVTMQIPANP